MSALETLETHITELESLVQMIRHDVINLSSGNKHASVDARKRLSVVSKLAMSIRGDCLAVAKPPKPAEVVIPSDEVSSCGNLIATDNVQVVPVELHMLEPETNMIVIPDVKELPEQSSVDEQLRVVAELARPEVIKSPRMESRNPRSRAARPTKVSRKKK